MAFMPWFDVGSFHNGSFIKSSVIPCHSLKEETHISAPPAGLFMTLSIKRRQNASNASGAASIARCCIRISALPSNFSALHHGLNYFHIRNGIFQWRRNIRVIQYRSGKQVPLNRVLVTYGKADFLGLILGLALYEE